MTDFLAPQPALLATKQLREGHDFRDQSQLGELLPRLQTSPPHSNKPENSTCLLAAKLTAVVLDELQMFEYTGLLSGTGGWSQQPAWRTELWRTYWQAQLSAQH